MKCYRHPREDALYECSLCGQPVCGDCMVFSGDSDQITCPTCNMDTAVDAHSDSAVAEQQEFARRAHELAHRASWRERFNVQVSLPLVLVVVALVVAHLWIDNRLEQAQETIAVTDPRLWENNTPAPQFTYVLAKISQYRAAKGRYPADLKALVPEFLPGEPKIMKTEERFNYVLDPKNGFVLSLPRADQFRFVKLYATGSGELAIE